MKTKILFRFKKFKKSESKWRQHLSETDTMLTKGIFVIKFFLLTEKAILEIRLYFVTYLFAPIKFLISIYSYLSIPPCCLTFKTIWVEMSSSDVFKKWSPCWRNGYFYSTILLLSMANVESDDKYLDNT